MKPEMFTRSPGATVSGTLTAVEVVVVAPAVVLGPVVLSTAPQLVLASGQYWQPVKALSLNASWQVNSL